MGRSRKSNQRERNAILQKQQNENDLRALKTNQRILQEKNNQEKENAKRRQRESMEKLRKHKSDLERSIQARKIETDRKIAEIKRSSESNLNAQMNNQMNNFKREQTNRRLKQENDSQKVKIVCKFVLRR